MCPQLLGPPQAGERKWKIGKELPICPFFHPYAPAACLWYRANTPTPQVKNGPLIRPLSH